MTDTSSMAGQSPKLVVTLFESYGSGASYVSARVAQALGIPLHQQAFSSEEIEDAVTRREREGVLTRVFGAMGGPYAAYAGLEGPGVALAQRDNYELVLQNTRFVKEAALQGGVIVGRNGAFILSKWPGALHVRLDGPLERRIARAAEESGIDRERAVGSLRPSSEYRNHGSGHLCRPDRPGRSGQGGTAEDVVTEDKEILQNPVTFSPGTCLLRGCAYSAH